MSGGNRIASIKVRLSEGAVNLELIAELEKLLDEAKSGEIYGLAYATVQKRSCTGSGWVGLEGQQNSMSTAIMRLYHRYAFELLHGEESL